MTNIEYRVPNIYPGQDLIVNVNYGEKDVYDLSSDIHASLAKLLTTSPFTFLLFCLNIGLIVAMFAVFGPTLLPVFIIMVAVVYISRFAVMADVEHAVEHSLTRKGYTGIKIYWRQNLEA